MSHLPPRDFWIDNLRSFITLLVVGHHAALAYAGFARFDPEVYIRSTHPVVDSMRWPALDPVIAFNDTFFMPLMFLLSGFFFFNALSRRGRGPLAVERLRRLGLPFLLAEVLIIPLAYLPAWLLAGSSKQASFIYDYIFNQAWPVGPPWFLWLLLAFNFAALALPPRFFTSLSAAFVDEPGQSLFIFALLAALALAPLSLFLGRYSWTGIGPFDFQLNRVLFYLVFFLGGAGLGAGNWQAALFANNRVAGLPVWFLLSTAAAAFCFSRWSGDHAPWLAEVSFAAACLLICCVFLWFFWRYITQGGIWRSLSANAFGIYLLHYPCVTWIQYLLLPVAWPAGLKFLLTFCGSLAASWSTAALCRKLPRLRRIF